MEIKIKQPGTGDEIYLDVEPEEYNNEQGWRVLFPEKDSFLLVIVDGDWQAVDEENLDPELIQIIIEAINEQQPEHYNGTTTP